MKLTCWTRAGAIYGAWAVILATCPAWARGQYRRHGPPSTAVRVPTRASHWARSESGAVNFVGRFDASGKTANDKATSFFAAKLGQTATLVPHPEQTGPRGTVTSRIQSYQGVPIEGTYVTAHIRGNSIRYARALTVTIPASFDPFPSLQADQARLAAQAAMPASSMPSAASPTLVITFDDSARPKLAWRVAVSTLRALDSVEMYIDAKAGDVISQHRLMIEGTGGAIMAPAEGACEGSPQTMVHMPYLQYGTNLNADADGTFALAGAPASVRLALDSPYIALTDAAAALPGPWTMPLQANTLSNTYTLTGNLPAFDAFYNFHIVRRWTANRVLANSAQRAWVLAQVPVHINLADTCNAYFNPNEQSLNFFQKGDGCANTATIPRVFYHEYGHGLQFNSGNGRNYDGATAEGLADTHAIYLTGLDNLPNITTGCPGSGRTCNNKYTYCDRGCTFSSNSTDIHAAGQVICATWNELRSALVTRYGADLGRAVANGLYFDHLTLISGSMPDSYQPIVAIDDDDDGDPSNGTRHSCEINQAFASGAAGATQHFPQLTGMVPSSPSLAMAHTPPGVVDATLTPALKLSVRLVPHPVCDPTPKLKDVLLHYKVNDEATEHTASMSLDSGSLYTATLPNVAAPATVRYIFTANLDNANFTHPYQIGVPAGSEAAYWHTVRYAHETVLYAQDFESSDGAMVAGTDAADGRSEWSWGPAAGMGGDPLTAYTGTQLWGHNRPLGGDDVYSQGRVSVLKLPVLDATQYAQVRLQYWRMLRNPELAQITVNGTPVWERPRQDFYARDPQWLFEDIDISRQASGKADVQIAFVVHSSTANPYEMGGWHIDTVQVTGTAATAVVNPASAVADSAAAPVSSSQVFAAGCCATLAGEPWALALLAVRCYRRHRRTAHVAQPA